MPGTDQQLGWIAGVVVAVGQRARIEVIVHPVGQLAEVAAIGVHGEDVEAAPPGRVVVQLRRHAIGRGKSSPVAQRRVIALNVTHLGEGEIDRPPVDREG